MSTSERDGLSVRLPQGMRQRLKVSAAINNRSMNAEVVFRLERDFARENESPAAAATAPGSDHKSPRVGNERHDERT